jgi:hypothetical protein
MSHHSTFYFLFCHSVHVSETFRAHQKYKTYKAVIIRPIQNMSSGAEYILGSQLRITFGLIQKNNG